MAFFKFRKGGDESAATPHQPESIEAMRKRARHRLIGAAVLVLAGVIGFPVLFDTQPRPIAVDIPIEIPDRNKVPPLTLPATPASAVSGPGLAAAPQAPAITADAEEKQAPAQSAPPSVAIKTGAKAEPQPETKPEPKAEAAKLPAAKPADGAKARALLEGKPLDVAAAAAGDGRFVVQVGAFADAGKAREARLKVEKSGLKTYTHVAETRDGKRTRVRVGPFASRAEADKAADKIKRLDLPAAILTL
jgi:DedD protein